MPCYSCVVLAVAAVLALGFGLLLYYWLLLCYICHALMLCCCVLYALDYYCCSFLATVYANGYSIVCLMALVVAMA